MRTVGIFEAKTHFSSLIESVEKGETVLITKHGRPVARLAPPESVRKESVESVLDELFRIADETGGEKVDVLELIAEGRRR